jgi:hypothetical protein
MIELQRDTALPDLPRPADPGLWVLPAGRAQVLPAAESLRWLVVDAGRVWMTEQRDDRPSVDVVVSAGQRCLLPPDSTWIVEGWPSASARLLEAPPVPVAAATAGAAWGELARAALQMARALVGPRRPAPQRGEPCGAA